MHASKAAYVCGMRNRGLYEYVILNVGEEGMEDGAFRWGGLAQQFANWTAIGEEEGDGKKRHAPKVDPRAASGPAGA